MVTSKGNRRRRFGRIRELPSGRFQVRYPGPDGVDRPAPNTFRTKTDAEQWLVRKEAELLAGGWTDPDATKIELAEYAARWIRERDLAESTAEKYREYLRRFVEPRLGTVSLGELSAAKIRTWYAQLPEDGATDHYRAKTYRFLRAVLTTAVEDGLIQTHPCRIKGAGQEYSPERPTYTVEQVLHAADSIQPRYRALVLLAAFTQLRYSELMRLRRADVDIDEMLVTVRPSDQRGKSKSRAGVRTVAIPEALSSVVDVHLKIYAEKSPAGRFFVGPKGGTPSVANFTQLWHKTLDRAELPRIHFHDLRHTGNTLVAEDGASLKGLMRRMGHSSTRAAIIYQHATDKQDRVLASRLSARIDAARAERTNGHAAGTD